MPDDKKLTSVVSSTSASQRREYAPGEWKERNYDLPPDDHPIYQLVGRVAAEWARLEHELDRIIWNLSYTISPRTACITAQLMGAQPRYRTIMAQLSLRAAKEPEFSKHIQPITGIMNDTHHPQEQRNRIIHDPWLVDTIHDDPAQFRAWPAKKRQYGIMDVDVSDINKAIGHIKGLTVRIEAVSAEIDRDVAASLERHRQRHPASRFW